jgi:RNA polymerase sigma factor (TIGR02999 family)
MPTIDGVVPPNPASFPPASGAAPGTVTRLLRAAAEGEPAAPNKLLAVVYEHLRAIARQRMAGERPSHTLQATALVHEAYVRVLGRDLGRWNDRGHFFRAAAEAMRRILVDHARASKTQKRGGGSGGRGGRAALEIESVVAAAEADPAGILALDEAISRLEKVDPQAAAVVRLRFYAGLGVETVAEALGLSARTVKRDSAFARAWLRQELGAAECRARPGPQPKRYTEVTERSAEGTEDGAENFKLEI